jgi:uncharacterized damage-inducible protein DinB
VRVGDIRFLFGYDRWATSRLLAAADGIGEDQWTGGEAVGERSLAAILVHALGAHQRWRHALTGSEERPRPERGPIPSVAELSAAWDAEWAATDAWLAGMDDEWLASIDEDRIPFWQMLAHLANHGMQHRSEAAALLTDLGRSPGDLDMLDFAEALAAG